MINVTVTLDEETATLARVEAAQRHMSLSRYIGEVLRERSHESREYGEAMQRYLGSRFELPKRPGERYLTREEAHDRAGLRRR